MTSNLKSPHSPTSQNELSRQMSRVQLSDEEIETVSRDDVPPAATGPADEELDRFRREWEDEVKAKKVATGPGGDSKAVDAGGVRWKPADSSTRTLASAATPAAVSNGQAVASAGHGTTTGARSPTHKARAIPHASSSKREGSPVNTKHKHGPSSPTSSKRPHGAPGAIPRELDLEELAAKHIIVSGPSLIKGKGSGMIAASDKDKEKDKLDAVAVYARAVEAEQSGKLNEALVLYRKSFKMDDNVDKLYARSVAKATQAPATAPLDDTPSSTDLVSAAVAPDEPYTFQRHIQLQPDYEKQPLGLQPTKASPASAWSRPSPLTAILDALSIPAERTQFLPEEENLPVPIAKLPAELLETVLAFLDVASIERFAMTCWRARYLTARAGVWRKFVQGIWRGPGMLPECQGRLDGPDTDSSSETEADDGDRRSAIAAVQETTRDRELRRIRELVSRHKGEWRTTLIEEERVRMDGCYISVCHYVRPGAGDQWVTITHLITYHRFLRFYPDGTVISYLTTDHPSDVVPVLRPSLRDKGLHFGRWRLIRSDAIHTEEGDHPHGTDVKDLKSNGTTNGTKPDGTAAAPTNGHKPKAKSKPMARIMIMDLLEPGLDSPKYEFEMELGLRETARGKWNKLDLLHYNSTNLMTGENLELSLKNQKPFYFSKVKSYHPQL